MTSFSEADAGHMAQIIRVRRPRWAVSAIVNALGTLALEGQSPGAALDAALRAASDPKAETPVMIPRYATPVLARPGTDAARCGDHPEQDALNCRDCRSMELTGERDPADRGKATEGRRNTPVSAADFAERWNQIKATANSLALDTKRHTLERTAEDVNA